MVRRAGNLPNHLVREFCFGFSLQESRPVHLAEPREDSKRERLGDDRCPHELKRERRNPFDDWGS